MKNYQKPFKFGIFNEFKKIEEFKLKNKCPKCNFEYDSKECPKCKKENV
jgi:hypothetical protein